MSHSSEVNISNEPEASRLSQTFETDDGRREGGSCKAEPTCGLSSDEPEGSAEEVQGADEYVQEAQSKAHFGCVYENALHLFRR